MPAHPRALSGEAGEAPLRASGLRPRSIIGVSIGTTWDDSLGDATSPLLEESVEGASFLGSFDMLCVLVGAPQEEEAWLFDEHRSSAEAIAQQESASVRSETTSDPITSPGSKPIMITTNTNAANTEQVN